MSLPGAVCPPDPSLPEHIYINIAMNLLPAHIKGQNLLVSAPVNLACQLLLTMAGTKGGEKKKRGAERQEEMRQPHLDEKWLNESLQITEGPQLVWRRLKKTDTRQTGDF